VRFFLLQNSLPYPERMTGVPSQDLALALDELATLHGADNLLDPSSKLDECFTVPYVSFSCRVFCQ